MFPSYEQALRLGLDVEHRDAIEKQVAERAARRTVLDEPTRLVSLED